MDIAREKFDSDEYGAVISAIWFFYCYVSNFILWIS
jgi:hypothetical protein